MNTERRIFGCAQLLAAFSVLSFIQAKRKHAERHAQLPIVPSHDPSIVLNDLDEVLVPHNSQQTSSIETN
jgi:hypothetical protein